MSLNSILWDINNTSFNYHYNNDNIYKDVSNDYVSEGIKIFPSYFFLLFIINNAYEPLKNTLDGLENNIAFLNIDCKDCENLVLYCDWCSVCNGILETSKQNIVNNPKLINTIDFSKLNNLIQYLDFVLEDRKNKITQEQINEFCLKTFNRINIKLLLISEIYLKTEQVELRWCPFKRSKDFYYRNKDNRYITPTEKNIKKIGKILNKYETITCNNCPKIINENWRIVKNDNKSVFTPLVEYMVNDIKNNKKSINIYNNYIKKYNPEENKYHIYFQIFIISIIILLIILL